MCSTLSSPTILISARTLRSITCPMHKITILVRSIPALKARARENRNWFTCSSPSSWSADSLCFSPVLSFTRSRLLQVTSENRDSLLQLWAVIRTGKLSAPTACFEHGITPLFSYSISCSFSLFIQFSFLYIGSALHIVPSPHHICFIHGFLLHVSRWLSFLVLELSHSPSSTRLTK